MLDADVDAFRNDALSDLLVDDDSDRTGIDVEDSSCSSMVVFVRHALVYGSINDYINDVSVFVGCEGLGDVDGSVLLEAFFEFMSGSAFVAVAVGHGLIIIINNQ